MPKKLSVKKIIELDNAGMSGRDIALHYQYQEILLLKC